MSGAVDVLSVMDRAVTFAAAYHLTNSAEDYAEARAAVADAFDVLRMSAEALESAAKCVGGDLALVLGDRAMFARAALARCQGAAE